MSSENPNLTPTKKQEEFAHAFILYNNATAAYKKVYDCETDNINTIRQMAWEVRHNPTVSARIKELQEKAWSKVDTSIQRIANEYAKIAFTDMPGIITYNKCAMTLEDFDNLTSDQRACIKKFKVKTITKIVDDEPVLCDQVEVELHDKQHALDMLGKYRGMFVDKKEIDIKTDSIKVVIEN